MITKKERKETGALPGNLIRMTELIHFGNFRRDNLKWLHCGNREIDKELDSSLVGVMKAHI